MAVSACPAPGELVEAEIDRVATQYREASRLLGYMRAVLGLVEEAARATCVVPSFFDLDTAVGDQLTLLGKRLGWPRCHCVCTPPTVFGFDCGGTSYLPVGGFCDQVTWADCSSVSDGEICLDDDEVYRGFLKARRYQVLGLYDVASLEAAIRHIWGPTGWMVEGGRGRVVVAAGRPLTDRELVELPLVMRVLPIAPGVTRTISLDAEPPFGFGAGWGGLCDGSEWLCPIELNRDLECVALAPDGSATADAVIPINLIGATADGRVSLF